MGAFLNVLVYAVFLYKDIESQRDELRYLATGRFEKRDKNLVLRMTFVCSLQSALREAAWTMLSDSQTEHPRTVIGQYYECYEKVNIFLQSSSFGPDRLD